MVLWSFNYWILIDSAGYKIVVTKKAELQISKQDKMQSVKHSKPMIICWGVLLLLLLWLCRENVRIIEPISFYPSEIFLSIVPLGNRKLLTKYVECLKIIQMIPSMIWITHVHGRDYAHSPLESEDKVIIWSFQMFLCFFFTPWIREILYVLVSSEKQ